MPLRLACAADGDALAAIYAPMVATSAASFELIPPTGEDMATRVVETVTRYPWLILEEGGTVVGYAYAHGFHTRAAYDWSVETSIYVHRDRWRTGAGRTLYTALLACLREQGYWRAIAGITLPNPASVGLHERLGFRPIGVYHRIGWKFASWHDVGMWELDLRPDHGAIPAPPTPIGDLDPEVVRRVCQGGA